ncbi:MAG TPA: amidohydrolase family protein [Gemmatimonadales bacterium]|nr:amidohydrolase family protein [Gemmatimonadales bacterium]
MRASILVAGALALAASAPSARAQTIAITGGTIYPVSGPRIERGTVLIVDGRIAGVGSDVAIPPGAATVDATGKWVTPGLFNASTSLGLTEVGSGGNANETSADGHDEVAAAFQPWLAYNPQSVLIPSNRDYGVTTVAVWPAGNLVAGQGAVLDLGGGSLAAALVKPSAAMFGRLEGNRSAGVGARGELIGKLTELLDDTKAYMNNKAAYNAARMRPFAFRRVDLEAMIPVVTGRIPFVVAVDQAADILAALDLAKAHGLKLVLYSAAEGWMVAGQIAAARVPVMVGAMNNVPRSFTSLGSRQDNPALLRKAGVRVVLIGNAGGQEDLFNVRNIRYEAGNAVGYGMTWDDALVAVTLAPARVLGVADKVGALQVGLEGNVVVWSGDPFEFATRAEHVYVRGVEYTAPSRQDLLTERYKQLPPTYGAP